MKVRVNRFIRGGTYFVSFQSIDLTPDDAQRFEKFGAPAVRISVGLQPKTVVPVAISSLNPSQTAGFNNEDDAKQYEERVSNEVKALYDGIRAKQDQFSQTREVDL